MESYCIELAERLFPGFSGRLRRTCSSPRLLMWAHRIPWVQRSGSVGLRCRVGESLSPPRMRSLWLLAAIVRGPAQPQLPLSPLAAPIASACPLPLRISACTIRICWLSQTPACCSHGHTAWCGHSFARSWPASLASGLCLDLAYGPRRVFPWV